METRNVEHNRFLLKEGDCLEVLKTLPDNFVHAVVTDPPAGISFMGKEWDHHKGGRTEWVAWMTQVAAECFRVLRPGGHALVWALPRTSHWTATAWEDAGFEVRDRIAHCFGSGFPKSFDVSKGIDKMLGAEREVFLRVPRTVRAGESKCTQADKASELKYSHAATEEAKRWEGWASALKPAIEDYWLLRKPLAPKMTIAANILEHETGALNIGGCRVGADVIKTCAKGAGESFTSVGHGLGFKGCPESLHVGRWPAHLIWDGSEEVAALFPTTGPSKPHAVSNKGSLWGSTNADRDVLGHHDQGGSAARYFMALPPDEDAFDAGAVRLFYCPKASKKDREAGLEEMQRTPAGVGALRDGSRENTEPKGNHHPTVKATPLMRYLCKLVTPVGGFVLDPFMGSGSTGVACMYEGFRFVGIERESDYFSIAQARIQHHANATEPQGEEAVKDCHPDAAPTRGGNTPSQKPSTGEKPRSRRKTSRDSFAEVPR